MNGASFISIIYLPKMIIVNILIYLPPFFFPFCMLTKAPALASTSLQPLERSLPSVCTWDLERPAGPGLLGLGICPGWFFLRPSMSKYPQCTDGPNSLSVRGLRSRLFLGPAVLSSASLSQLGTEVLCLRMSLQPSFHGQVWELTELTFIHTHTPLVTFASFSPSSEFVSFCLIFVLWQWPLLSLSALPSHLFISLIHWLSNSTTIPA